MLQFADNVPMRDAPAFAEGDRFYESCALRQKREVPLPDGRVTLTAKAEDGFHFVSHVSVTLDPARRLVTDFSCDCPEAKTRFCRHGVALLISLGDTADLSEETAAEETAREPACAPPEDAAGPGRLYAPLPDEAPETFPDCGSRPEDDAAPEYDFKPEDDAAPEYEAEPEYDHLPEYAAAEAEEAPPATPEPEAPFTEAAPPAEPEPERPPFSPPGMQVRFGTDAGTGEPVLWCPNDTAQLFHPNTGIIGTMGTGKTQFTKAMITQLVRERERNYGNGDFGILIFDYKGDYNETKPDFVRATNARVLKPYHLPYNPFTLQQSGTFKPLLPRHTADQFTESISRLMYQLGPKQEQFLLDCIMEAYAAQGIKGADPATWSRMPPTFEQVWQIWHGKAETADVLAKAMNKLHDFEIFDSGAAGRHSISSLLNGVVVIDLVGYTEDLQNFIVAITLDQLYIQMQAWGSSATDGRYRQLRQLVLVDEADNFMRQRVATLRKIMKEGREFGVGTVLSTQSLTHFIGGDDNYSKYILTWVVHATNDLHQKDIEYIFKLPPKDSAVIQAYADIKSLEKHESVVKISNDAPARMRDKAFWQLMEEDRETGAPD